MSRTKERARSLALGVLLWMLLVALVPLLIMAVQGLHCAGQAIVDLESMHLRGVLHARRTRIDDWLAERRDDLLALAAYPRRLRECSTSLGSMTDAQKEAYRGLLRYVHNRSGTYESLAVYGADGTEIAAIRGDGHIEDDKLVPAAFKTKLLKAPGIVLMPPHVHGDGAIGIHVGVPVTSTNQVRLGYVVAAMSLPDTVYPILSDTGDTQPRVNVYLLTREGCYASRPAGKAHLLTEEQHLPEQILEGNSDKVIRYRDDQGRRVLGVSVSMPELGWVLVAETNEADAFAWLQRLRLRAFWTGAATLCVVFLLAVRSSRRLLIPMRHLSETARRIAAGHWQERVGHLRGAEPEEVGQAFNCMLDELAAVQKRLVQSASLSAIGELSARVVHEMRNPLSSVKMNIKALRHQVKDDPTYSELADIAAGQAERLEHMLNDLLQYGKPLDLQKTPQQFKALADDVVTGLAQQAAARDVELSVHDATAGRAFMADREHMVRAVTNLVDNAIRVSPQRSTVELAAEIAGPSETPMIVISVRDGGGGIPNEMMKKLFKPFFTTRSDGTGLGLANVRKTAELHGGEVAAENMPGGGARFTITVPIEERDT